MRTASVRCGQRRRRPGSRQTKFISQPADNLLDGQATRIHYNVGVTKDPYGAKCSIGQIEMVVLNTEHQVLPDRIIDTDACGPAAVDLSLAGESARCRNGDGRVDCASCPAALCVQQCPVERPTDLAGGCIEGTNLETIRYGYASHGAS